MPGAFASVLHDLSGWLLSAVTAGTVLVLGVTVFALRFLKLKVLKVKTGPIEAEFERRTVTADVAPSLQPKPSVASLARVPELPVGISVRVMTWHSKQCALCSVGEDLEIYAIDPAKSSIAPANLVVLCASCRARAGAAPLTMEDAQSLSRHARLLARREVSLDDKRRLVEKLYAEAIRLSLQTDWRSLVVARVRCEEILKRFDPFHEGAKLLLEKLLIVEQKVRAEKHLDDRRYHADGVIYKDWQWCALHAAFLGLCFLLSRNQIPMSMYLALYACALVPVWLRRINTRVGTLVTALFFVPFLLVIHESSHLIAMYMTGSVKNAAGKRMPFFTMYKYWEVEGLPPVDGFGVALERARSINGVYIPAQSINASKMLREWLGNIRY
jgi:hypothetical protein